MKWNELKDTKIGEITKQKTLENLFEQIIGAVAWPGENPGFVVVLGISYDWSANGNGICVLDEAESNDMRDLLRECDRLQDLYRLQLWTGDGEDGAYLGFYRGTSDFDVPWVYRDPQYEEIDRPYAFLLPHIRKQLNPSDRHLFLRESRTASYLAQVVPTEIHAMNWGAFPAIEALGMGVIELTESASYCDIEAYTGKSRAQPTHEGLLYPGATDRGLDLGDD
ncbi:hypothetical protein ACFL3F_02070 [Planctomycetota bacterium]